MSTSVLRRAVLALAFLLVGLTGRARAADPPHGAGGAAPVISGVVQDTAGTPLPDARVVIAELNRVTTTAGDGYFVFRALRAGTYHLDASLIGYAPRHAEVTVPA